MPTALTKEKETENAKVLSFLLQYCFCKVKLKMNGFFNNDFFLMLMMDKKL